MRFERGNDRFGIGGGSHAQHSQSDLDHLRPDPVSRDHCDSMHTASRLLGWYIP